MPSAVNSKDIEDLINNLKSGISLWEDLISKSSKFSNSIKSMTMACSDLLDSMHIVCDIASKSSCGLRNTGISLTKLVMREKKLEMKVCSINNVLNENMVGELDKCVNEWKRSSLAMKKEREHEWRRANTEYQKSLMEVDRTEKKLRKKNSGKVGLSETANLQIEYANQDAQNKRRYVEELERCALRRAAIEERQRFKQFLALLKPILDCQLSLREDLDCLEEVVAQLYGERAENLDVFPEELEQHIQEHMVRSGSRSSIPPSFSTLSKQPGSVSNGSRTSLNSASMSTTSSEWNSNSVLISACMEVSSRLNENLSNISHDSGIKSDNANTNSDSEWDRTLTHGGCETIAMTTSTNDLSSTDGSSTEDDNDASTDHNSQDGVIDPQRPEEGAYDLPPPPPSHCAPPSPLETGLYPNQAIPGPTVYANLQQLKMSAARKFGTDCLSQRPLEEASTSFVQSVTGERPKVAMPTSQTWGNLEFEEQAGQYVMASPPPPLYGNGDGNGVQNGESAASFLNYAESTPQNTQSKTSMIRRGSLATEMQVPQTPRTTSTLRRPSVQQERIPSNPYSNKVRGRSVSVTREMGGEQEDQAVPSEDFNTIRQRIATRINSELKPPPPTLPKPKQTSPTTNYMSNDYAHAVTSPGTTRSHRFFSTHRFQQQTRPTGGTQGLTDCSAGEGSASGDFDMSGLHSLTVSRKEDRFKQQLMQVLATPSPRDPPGAPRDPPGLSQALASFRGSLSSSSGATSQRPKQKSAIPNSKYIY